MSTSAVIGRVSASLRSLLQTGMELDPHVTILAPDEAGSTPRINLFLYKIQENPVLKNMDWQPKLGRPDQLTPPPLSLNLFYLMTAYAENNEQDGNADAHQFLGDAMRVFFENPILSAEPNDREQVKIMLNPVDMDELTKIWGTFSKPFRLSVVYEVSVVQLDKVDGGRTLAKRVERFGLETRAPYKPPVVETMTPGKGPPQTKLTFRGRHLTGWKAYLTIMGRRLAVKTEEKSGKLIEDQFQIELPNDLSPGFHELRIDVAGLFRKTFFFEIISP